MYILFKNATIVTMNPASPVLYNADLTINDGKIKLGACEKPARTIDCTNKVIMPGLYNCHTHAAMTLFRGFANDRTLEDWLFNHLIPAESKLTPELVRTGTLLAMAEMLASGTIAFSDMYCHMDYVAKAAEEAGMLANISNGIVGMDRDSFDFYKCNEFLQTSRARGAFFPDCSVVGMSPRSLDNAVVGTSPRSLENARATTPRIQIEAAIHACYTSHPPAWEQVTDFAHKHNLRMHLHLSETRHEHESCIKNFGATPTQMFARYGVFDVPTLAAHGVWASDEDLDILREKGVTIAHNPLSNLKLASGLAPVTKMLAHGVNVALGTDGVSSNNSHDMFEEMKMASLLQKYITGDPTALPAWETLKMATVNGAKAQGREKESGIIADGYDADMLLVDFDNPRQTMCYDPVLNLAYSTSGRDVQMTICRGRVLYEKGEYTTIDIERVLHEARSAKQVFL